jgi:tetratricopeptide (TPR) repeat protein
MMPFISSRSRMLLPILLLVSILYIPNLNSAFTNWDDQIHVTENKRVQTLTWESAADHFRPNKDYMYHPLTMLMYSVEWYLGGGTPRIFHTVSLLLHLLNIILVYRIMLRVSGDNTAALIIALLFGIHPLNAEAVSWISARKDLLYSFFILLGLDLYFRFLDGKNRPALYSAMLLTFVLGLLSKPTMVIFPLLLVLIDWWQQRPLNKGLVLEKLPFFLIAAGFGIVTIVISKASADKETIMSLYAWKHQVLLVCYASVFYAGKVLVPAGLSALYHYPLVFSGSLPIMYYAAPLIAAAVAAFVITAGRVWRFIWFGAALYFIPLLLVLQVLPFNNTSLVSDRYAYLSTVGVLFIVVSAVRRLMKADHGPFWNAAASILLLLVSVVFSVGTVQRTAVWKSSMTVFSSVIEQDPTVWIAYANRAIEQINNGQYDAAMADVQTAILIHPYRRSLYGVRGNIYFNRKEYAKAAADFDSVTFAKTAKPYDYYNKGAALYYLGRFDSAGAYYAKARAADSTIGRVYHGIGMLEFTVHRSPLNAAAYFDTAVAYDRTLWESYYYRSAAHYALGRSGAALNDLSSAMLYNPALTSDTLTVRVDQFAKTVSERAAQLRLIIDNGDRRDERLNELLQTYLKIGDVQRAEKIRSEIERRTGSVKQ